MLVSDQPFKVGFRLQCVLDRHDEPVQTRQAFISVLITEFCFRKRRF